MSKNPCQVVDAAAAPDGLGGVGRCAQCSETWLRRPDDPPCAIDDDGTPMQWCGDACSEAWMDADPKRREGWISVGDMTREQLNEALGDIGLRLDGVGPRQPS